MFQKKYLNIFFSVIFGFILMFSTTDINTLTDFEFLPTLVRLFLWVLFSFISYGILFVVDNFSIQVSPKDIRWYKIFVYFMPAFIISLIYLIAFYPGNMTWDSFVQWKQAQEFRDFSNWHPASHTLLIAILIRIWHTPASVALFHCILVSIISAYGAYSIEKNGMPSKIVWILYTFLCINPAFGITNVTLWKDVTFSAGISLFTIAVINILLTNGKWLKTISGSTIFILATLLVLISRHNGKYCLFLTLPVIIILLRKDIKRILTVSIISLFIYFIITVPIYKALNIPEAPESEKYSVALSVFGGIIANGKNITPEQYQYASQIMPIEDWVSKYNPFNADPYKANPNINQDMYVKNKSEFLKNLAILSLQNPKEALHAYLTITSLVWKIIDMGYTYTYSFDIDPQTKELTQVNDNTVETKSLAPQIKEFLKNICKNSSEEPYKTFFWRPALYLYLMLSFSLASAFVNGIRSLAAPLAIVINNLIVMVSIPAQDYRYLYGNFLAFIFVILFSFIKYSNTYEEIKIEIK